MLDDDTSLFRLKIPPVDLIFEAPPPTTQQMAFDDIINQLIGHLAAAARDKSDPLRVVRILTACHSITSAYTEAGFDIFAEFEQALRHDLHNALRMARRVFLRSMFLAPPHEQQAYLQTLRDTGWRTSGESGEDYDRVVHELFDGDRLRPSALEERARRHHAPG